MYEELSRSTEKLTWYFPQHIGKICKQIQTTITNLFHYFHQNSSKINFGNCLSHLNIVNYI